MEHFKVHNSALGLIFIHDFSHSSRYLVVHLCENFIFEFENTLYEYTYAINEWALISN